MDIPKRTESALDQARQIMSEVLLFRICDAAQRVERDYRRAQIRDAVTAALEERLQYPSTLPADRKELARLTGLRGPNATTLELSPSYLHEREQPLERGLRKAQRALRDTYCDSDNGGAWKNQSQGVLESFNSCVKPAEPNWFVPLSFTDSTGKQRHMVVYAAPLGLIKRPNYFRNEPEMSSWQPSTPANIMHENNKSDVIAADPWPIWREQTYDTRPGMTYEVYKAMVQQSRQNGWPLPDNLDNEKLKTYTLLTGLESQYYDFRYVGSVNPNDTAEFGTVGYDFDVSKEYAGWAEWGQEAKIVTFRPSLEVDSETGDIIDIKMSSPFGNTL